MSTVHQFSRTPQGPPERTWNLRLDLTRREGETRATVVMDLGDHQELRATGVAYLEPGSAALEEVGDELAAASALSQLAHFLVEAATSDISEYHRDPVAFGR